MKYRDYKFTTSSESLDLTYDQACEYFEETLDQIERSKFDLFNDDEELSLIDARKKYNEINRRLQTFGQAFELFMKYIIHAARIEKKPNITIDELWNKWIRGHQMIPLINEKANSEEVLPNFKEIFNLSMNSCYGFYGFDHIRHLGIRAMSESIEPITLFTILQPHNYQGGSITEEEIEKIIETNTAIYEKCRYNVEKMTNYDFNEVFCFISFVKFFAKMIHISKNKTRIDYNVAYVHAIAEDPVVRQLLQTFRSEEEIEKILNDEFFNSNPKLLAYLLTMNNYSVNQIKSIMKMSKHFEDPNNLYAFLTYNVSIEDIKKCNEKGIDLMLLVSDFTLEQIMKLIDIPVVGEYLNKNFILVNNIITQRKSDVGLNFEDWYKLLNNEQLKENPELLRNIILNYMEVYRHIEKNNFCNSIFAVTSQKETSKDQIRYEENKSFSQCFSDILLSNISNNIKFFKEKGINFDNLPVSLDSENIKKIFDLIIKNNINYISLPIFAYPYNEVLSIINYMKSKDYDFSSSNFPVDFWKEYNEQAKYDKLLKVWLISDEFLEENGLIRISNNRYCENRVECLSISEGANPLPNLKK